MFLLAPLVSFTLAFGYPCGGSPLAPGWCGVEHQRRRPLHLRHLVAGRLRPSWAGWASNPEVPVSRRILSAAQMVSCEVSIGFVIITVILLSGLAQSADHRREAGRRLLELERAGRGGAQGSAGRPDHDPRCRRFLFVSALAETNRLPSSIAAGGRVRAGGRLPVSNTPPRPICCSPSASDANIVLDVRPDQRPVLRGLAGLAPDPAHFASNPTAASFFAWRLQFGKIIFFPFLSALQGDRAALPAMTSWRGWLGGVPPDSPRWRSPLSPPGAYSGRSRDGAPRDPRSHERSLAAAGYRTLWPPTSGEASPRHAQGGDGDLPVPRAARSASMAPARARTLNYECVISKAR